jgi:hypothetical protein
MIFFKRKKKLDTESLNAVVEKKSDTAYMFVDINNDLGLAIKDGGTRWSKLQTMSYAYARRAAVSAMLIQGVVDRGVYDHVMVVFQSLQLQTDTSTKFQNDAAKEAINFLLQYSPVLSMLFVGNLVHIAQDYDIPERATISDAELVESILETAFYEQSNRQ